MLPIEPGMLVAFAVAVFAVVISPGPDSLLIVRYTLTSGPRAGFAAVGGVQLGLVVHTALAVAGITLVVASSPTLFRLVALAGAGYLAYLGLQGLRVRGGLALGGDGGPAVGPGKACCDALFTNLLNPKVILLFLALFPNFVDVGRDDVTAQLVTLAVTLIVINTLWQAPLAAAAEGVRRWLGRPAVQRAVAQGTGAVLLVFAALMLYENWPG